MFGPSVDAIVTLLWEVVSASQAELTMFIAACVGYVIFAGWPALMPHLPDDKGTKELVAPAQLSEAERASKEIQRRFDSQNYRGVVALWPFVRLGDSALGVVLSCVIESMRQLGK